MKCPVISLDNKKVGDIDLDDAVFAAPSRPDILARAVNWQLAKRRAGTRKTKQRAEITGSTAKPFRQKGTGRARQGDRKAPQLRGGGVAFGPVVRSHAYSLPKKVRRLALRTALSAKQADGKLIILDKAEAKSAKTGELAKQVGKLGWHSALIIGGSELDGNFTRAARNIRGMEVLPQIGANVYDILRLDTLVLTRDAVDQLQERLK
ncbi:MAG: 50S ribosomal protein L4 [Rhodospirillales bacterium]|jgi:large subunit ribosomal protein L4|nr:50S ribosomal protein L4 [Rhodospirillaceae bacterium]MDP6426598.1 50S ribosomal protein L4 [Rhodospirillales bacterium]MDP6645185.1 50S ribosomal protein L4 [Rhodospirillales bacterium]MDP6840364.1 50S ribosomal protein L4 [Rhodospirillales bacterium]|tara:strand:- start:1955 stop:2575 length:621 start_codon:yes stop_codon:yes gene_type:complete